MTYRGLFLALVARLRGVCSRSAPVPLRAPADALGANLAAMAPATNDDINPPAQPGITQERDMSQNLNQDPIAADEARMQAVMKRQDARFVRSMDPEDCNGEAAELERQARKLERQAGVRR